MVRLMEATAGTGDAGAWVSVARKQGGVGKNWKMSEVLEARNPYGHTPPTTNTNRLRLRRSFSHLNVLPSSSMKIK